MAISISSALFRFDRSPLVGLRNPLLLQVLYHNRLKNPRAISAEFSSRKRAAGEFRYGNSLFWNYVNLFVKVLICAFWASSSLEN